MYPKLMCWAVGHRELDDTILCCTCVMAIYPDGVCIFEGREYSLIMIMAISYQFCTTAQELC